ncbi:MAG TPA: flippase-like domain-containing protein [Gaiellales bacterium]|nr:flippase-like domain-containing protein [Gaiellales bacterium]
MVDEHGTGSRTWSQLRLRGRLAQAVVGIAVSTLFVWLAFTNVSLHEVTGSLAGARWRWLVPATALLLLSVALRAIRWSMLYPAGRRPGPGACFWAMNVGYLANALLPFRAGEVIRVITLSRETGASTSQGFVTIVLERVFDLVTVAVLFLVVVPWLPAGWARTSLTAISVVALVAAAICVAVARSVRLRRIARSLVRRIPPLERRVGGLRTAAEALEPLQSPRAAGIVLAWSFLSWIVLLASTVMVEHAVVHGLPWQSGDVALVATTYAQAIPSSAASIGVFEEAARQSLAAFGVASGAALAFALTYHAVSVLPLLPLGLIGLGRMGVRTLLPDVPAPPLPAPEASLEVSVVIPCLNERETIERSVRNAWQGIALAGADGEVVVADNGSTDGSADLARAAGARVIHESRRGYGSAYLAGLAASRGRYILMGDGDGTYDFTALPDFLALCRGGAELVMGSRLRGTILPGAMPWHHRWIGNPVLTGLLNVLFRTGVSDAHCGLRMVARSALPRLELRTPGMEFASEMVINAKRANLRIAETPITYSPRPAGSHSKLHSVRDGLRHVRYILAWASGTSLAAPIGALAGIGLVLLMLPGATLQDVAAGAVILTAAALALQAAASLAVWRLITLHDGGLPVLRRLVDRRFLVATAAVTVAVAALAATDYVHRFEQHGHHATAREHSLTRASGS